MRLTLMASTRGIRMIAVVEAAKGTLVLLAGFGLLALVHHDLQAVAERLIHRFHLDPAHQSPQIFLHAARAMTDGRLWLLALTAFGYAAIRFVEAYGLWLKRPWAEWFAVLSGSVYLPIELFELSHGLSWPKLCLLAVNACIVGYLAMVLRQARRARALSPNMPG